MALNNSPWTWGIRKTAANMTGRISNGIQILQGKRAKGQSNPSPEFIFSQTVANAAWSIFGAFRAFVRAYYQILPTGVYAANKWYESYYEQAVNASSPTLTNTELAFVKFAHGQLTETPFLTTPIADVSLGTVVWTMPDVPLDGTQDNGDVMNVVIYNLDKQTATIGQQLRSTLAAVSFAIPFGTAAADKLTIVTSFVGSGALDPYYMGKSSDSVNVGITAVA